MEIKEIKDSIKDGILANINKGLINGETEVNSIKNMIEFAVNSIINENYNIRDGEILRDFYNDKIKMNDFTELPKNDFFKKYPSISEKQYNDTAFLYAKNELENKLLDTYININENKSYNMLEKNAIIHKTSEEYNKNNPYNIHFLKEELAKIESLADDKYREMEHEIMEDNITSSFNNLLNFINNGKYSKFNTQKNGMIIEKDTKTNCILFNEYDEENREDDGVMSTFGTKDDITKYLLSLKEHSIEIAWSDGLTDRQNKDIIKNFEHQIEGILEDIYQIENTDSNKIYFIQETGIGFIELKTTKETEEELNKIENKIQKFANEESKQNQVQNKKSKSYEEEM